MNTRQQRAECIETVLRSAGRGALDALTDLLELELQEALEELEQAADNISIWRAQGRAQAVRKGLAAINRQHKGEV